MSLQVCQLLIIGGAGGLHIGDLLFSIEVMQTLGRRFNDGIQLFQRVALHMGPQGDKRAKHRFIAQGLLRITRRNRAGGDLVVDRLLGIGLVAGCGSRLRAVEHGLGIGQVHLPLDGGCHIRTLTGRLGHGFTRRFRL